MHVKSPLLLTSKAEMPLLLKAFQNALNARLNGPLICACYATIQIESVKTN